MVAKASGLRAATQSSEIKMAAESHHLERSSSVDKSVAQVLKEHTVQICAVLDLSSLMPYLIQHGCLTDKDTEHFSKTESQNTNNLKFIQMLLEKGVAAFDSFLEALAHFTCDAPGEEAHKDLLDSLNLGIKRVKFSVTLPSPLPSTSAPHHSYQPSIAKQPHGIYYESRSTTASRPRPDPGKDTHPILTRQQFPFPASFPMPIYINRAPTQLYESQFRGRSAQPLSHHQYVIQGQSLEPGPLLRPVVIDGSNVALRHGNGRVFSCKGIQITVDWFRQRGHKEITVFVPQWRRETPRAEYPISDQEVLNTLEREGILKFTSSRRIGNKKIVCYDDRFIVRLASETNGVIVSNYNFRDLAEEKEDWRDTIHNRLVTFMFVNDTFMVAQDELRVSLLLQMEPTTIWSMSAAQPRPAICPYGERCTFGRRCRYAHPEREGRFELAKLSLKSEDQQIKQPGPDEKWKEEGKSISQQLQGKGEITIQVTNEEQIIEWEGYGLRLHIPKHSLPEDCKQLQLKISVLSANDCKLPNKDGVLVSAVYSFTHNIGDRKFRQPITLEMQHCVMSGCNSSLSIVQCEENSPPYIFKIIPGGTFYTTCGYGTICSDHFCGFGIWLECFRWFFQKVTFCAVLYYTNIKPRCFHFHLYIAPHLDATLKEIDFDVERKYNHFERGPVSPFEFDEGAPAIRLNLPKDPLSGWALKHLNTDELNPDDVVRIRPIIPFQVSASWAAGGEKPLSKLELQLDIAGAKRHKMMLSSPDHCTECGRIIAPPQSGKISPQAFAGFAPPSLADLMNVIGVDVQADWENVGLGLGLEPVTLKTVSKDCSGDVSSCMRRVFTEWCDSRTSEYSWRKVAEVLCSRSVNKPGLLSDMLERIKKLP